MGGLFDGGPSDGDIERAEQRAFEAEQERLRIQEQRMRQRESAETIQGQGIATPGNITLGDDSEETITGLEQVTAKPIMDATTATADPTATTPTPERDEAQRLLSLIDGGMFNFSQGIQF